MYSEGRAGTLRQAGRNIRMRDNESERRSEQLLFDVVLVNSTSGKASRLVTSVI